MRPFWRPRPPTPPENIKLHLPDGQVIPVDCVYAGKRRGGFHRWVVQLPRPIDLEVEGTMSFSISATMLPPKTEIVVGVAIEDRHR